MDGATIGKWVFLTIGAVAVFVWFVYLYRLAWARGYREGYVQGHDDEKQIGLQALDDLKEHVLAQLANKHAAIRG